MSVNRQLLSTVAAASMMMLTSGFASAAGELPSVRAPKIPAWQLRERLRKIDFELDALGVPMKKTTRTGSWRPIVPKNIDRTANPQLALKVDERNAIIKELVERRQKSFTLAPSINMMIWPVGALEAQVAARIYTDPYKKWHLGLGWSLATPTVFGEAGLGMAPASRKLEYAWGFELSGVQVAKSPIYGHNVEIGLPGGSAMLNEHGDIVAGAKVPLWGALGPGLEIGVRHPKLRQVTRPVVAQAVRAKDWIDDKLKPVTQPIRKLGEQLRNRLKRVKTSLQT
jgi:hypothetical protein